MSAQGKFQALSENADRRVPVDFGGTFKAVPWLKIIFQVVASSASDD
jgi:hypothetical protein